MLQDDVMKLNKKDIGPFLGKFVRIETSDNGYIKTFRGKLLEHLNAKITLYDRYVGKILIADKAITLIKEEDPGSFTFKLKEFDKLADKKLGI